ncbi:uncharacterized protein CDAR_110431 [Caerostris darwini]|uniref:Retroviral polymerase SH3-like domain-containing protein n=1 Tax=Caerostris darwini TaxID=1538125 RepID=A0AAV4M513_9ARAC|nr:uncharacterized protein CDAR_110431 [Caerostris darwini]
MDPTGMERFPLFNQRNWSIWKENMRFLLMDRGCWSFMDGSEPKLEETSTRHERSEYKQRQDRAFSTIYYGVDDQHKTLLPSLKNAAEAWKLLQEQFEPKSRAFVIGLLDKIFQIKFDAKKDTIAKARIRKHTKRLMDAGHLLEDIYPAFQSIRTLPPDFQEYAINLNQTPYELYFGHKPNVSYFRVFGCHVYVGTPKQLRKKLDLRCKHGIILGYARLTRGYRIWLLEQQKLIETCNVCFDESKRLANGILNFTNLNNKNWTEFKVNEPLTPYDYDDDSNCLEKTTIGDNLDKSVPDTSSSKLKPCSSIPFYRDAVLRKSEGRYDVYYGVKGQKVRLRSCKDAEKYCKDNNIQYDPNFLTLILP